jgi:SPP1 gp7 family putative phage head morphogenesis protein
MPSDWTRLPFDEAVAYLKAKKSITREEFDQLEREARGAAFTVTGINKLDILQHVLDSLVRATQEGGTLKEFAAGFDDVLATAGIDSLDPWRVETIFRTNVASAYGRGRWEQLTDRDVADEVWGWRYRTAGDDRVRPEHAALEGSVFKLGEGDVYFPPWSYQCRCFDEAVLRSEAEELGLESTVVPDEVAAAAEDESFVSPAVASRSTPDLTGYSAGLAGEFLREQRG